MARIKRAPPEQGGLFDPPAAPPPMDPVNPGLHARPVTIAPGVEFGMIPFASGTQQAVTTLREAMGLPPRTRVKISSGSAGTAAGNQAEAAPSGAVFWTPAQSEESSSGSAGTGVGNDPETTPSDVGPAKPAQPGEPFSHFSQTGRLNADEATRAIQGRSLGYVGVWFIRTQVAVCRDCHRSMIEGTAQFIPCGFEGQGPMATVYTCEQRKPNVQARCGVCGNPTVGEVAGLNG